MTASPSTVEPAGELPAPSGGEATRHLGKYELIRLLARGGMGEVYLARLPGELGFEKRLVVKTIRAELAADPRFVELFAAEARTAVALSHPNITPIYELGRAEDGSLYTAMGWVDGPSLQQLGDRLRSQDPPQLLELGAALYITREILDGLAHAHSSDHERPPLVHRDVTPRNVLLDRSGRVQLVDFGIAKPVDAEVRGIMGSAGYMAPEQARGDAVDPRADVFSVGCVLYELLCNRRAFPKEGVWISPDLDMRPDLPPALTALLARALAIDPAARFADAGAFLRALAPILGEHAPGYGTLDLAALLRACFPSGWALAAEGERDGEHTPATRQTGQARTFATRLTPLPSGTTPDLDREDDDAAGEASAIAAGAADADATSEPPPPLAPALSQPDPARRISVAQASTVVSLVLLLIVLWVAVRLDSDPEARPDPHTDARADSAAGPRPTPEAAPADTKASQPPDPLPAPVARRLTIEPPDAEVRIDGELLPGPPYHLPAPDDGTPRTLELSHPDYRTRTLALPLPYNDNDNEDDDNDDDGSDPLTLTLAPLEDGSLTVLAPGVAWAEVLLDGEPLGTTPLTDKPLREGKHKLEVRCTAVVCGEARLMLARTVQIRPGRGKTITAE